ncbi:MAG: NTP transferase domain-containing protein [Candidatus Omnitrophica bacterium]|nr:NTP transferase domain-containing protein [Candidatus Omnitrophota bacterium]
MNKKIAVIILAAGKGERMKSALPKVLHAVCRRPMLSFVLDMVKALKAKDVVSVLGYKHQEVSKFVSPGIKIALQKEIKGTADAVKIALAHLKSFKGTVLVLYGDNPLLKEETIKKLIKHHLDTGAHATLMTAKMEKPAGYGRILRDRYQSICGIVEEKDADDFQKAIKEINTGIVCFNKDSLTGVLKYIKPNNIKKEYYLTDAIGLLYKKGSLVESLEISDINEALGVNSRVELASANKIMQQRINEKLMKSGVTIIDPATAFISFDAKIGADTTIYPFTVIENNVKIGKQCMVGPFIRLRKGTVLKDQVTAGNFLEISRSKLGYKTTAKHFGFLGDCRIGSSVNVGAGTVSANYDGKNKNITVIKDRAFIGSDSVLVAPVRIGKNARTGAGSVVTRNKNIPDGTTVVGVPARPIKRSTFK